MKTTIITAVLSSIIMMGFNTVALADGSAAAKSPTCKQQAKQKGLKDAAAIKAFIKECKAANKTSTEKSSS